MFRYIESCWPLWVLVQVGPPSEAALTAHFEHMASKMRARRALEPARRLAYVLQVNDPRFRQANAAERALLAAWIRRDAKLMQDTAVGLSFVIDSALLRGALTAVFWLARTPVPQRVHATLDEAVCFALDELERAKLPTFASRTEVLHRVRAEVSANMGEARASAR